MPNRKPWLASALWDASHLRIFTYVVFAGLAGFGLVAMLGGVYDFFPVFTLCLGMAVGLKTGEDIERARASLQKEEEE